MSLDTARGTADGFFWFVEAAGRCGDAFGLAGRDGSACAFGASCSFLCPLLPSLFTDPQALNKFWWDVSHSYWYVTKNKLKKKKTTFAGKTGYVRPCIAGKAPRKRGPIREKVPT